MEGTDSLSKEYEPLRLAVMELYLSVKIRSDEEIDAYGKDQFNEEKNSSVIFVPTSLLITSNPVLKSL